MSMPPKENKILELRSPELEEIMTKPPAWLTRRGIPMVVALISFGLVLAAFIHSPEIVKAQISLTEHPEGTPSSGSILLAADGPCKVRPGQAVEIKFAQFPYMEFGIVIGIVEDVKYVAGNNAFLVTVKLNNGLHSNTGKQLGEVIGMQGDASIIIANPSLLQQLAGPVLKFLNLR